MESWKKAWISIKSWGCTVLVLISALVAVTTILTVVPTILLAVVVMVVTLMLFVGFKIFFNGDDSD